MTREENMRTCGGLKVSDMGRKHSCGGLKVRNMGRKQENMWRVKGEGHGEKTGGHVEG